MATKIERVHKKINEAFAEELAKAMATRFRGLKVVTQWNIFSMTLVTTRKNGKDFTREQMQFLKGFEAGYIAAEDQVHE